jgi:hypothetical protein
MIPKDSHAADFEELKISASYSWLKVESSSDVQKS